MNFKVVSLGCQLLTNSFYLTNISQVIAMLSLILSLVSPFRHLEPWLLMQRSEPTLVSPDIFCHNILHVNPTTAKLIIISQEAILNSTTPSLSPHIG